MHVNLFCSVPKKAVYSHHQLLWELICYYIFVFHPLNQDPGTSDKKAKQLNSSRQRVKQAGMSINVMFLHYIKMKNWYHFSYNVMKSIL